SQFSRLDGAANAELQLAAERDRQKAQALATVLSRLTLFIDRSARQVELTDQRMKSNFNTIQGL
ncbi:MAG: hypothetical protein FWD93_03230, partial [Coriobacteriia bacterium]|nr:hypothetical protein [Coriobacteriia bacterium]